ncbi:MAG: hypothetical protein NTV24_03420, partial [Candidatus Woesebacteria bacterium]|nr:hypothetical protein [Candidatus Woesebacteria bacterium]
LYTLKNLDFAKVISQGTINAGYEWLNYISRGSSFLNLFRLQGIPDWYLTSYLPNTDHAYAGFYLTKNIPIFISFLFPIVAFLGLLIPPKEKVEKYIVSFFIFLLLVSMFFVSGTNSPLGFIYEFLYTKIPGFNIFRSPYYKFAPAYLIPFCFLLSYSLSKIIKSVSLKIKVRGAICEFVLFLFVILGWFAYHKIIFNSKDLFFWQPGISTLVRVPDHVNEFGNWLNNTDIKGRILMVPPFDKTWRDDAYNWGYWSLSALPSLLSKNASFVANDIGINSGEEGWINELYTLLSNKDSENFVKVSSQLGIRYVFLKRDYSNDNDSVQNAYSDIINRFVKNGNFTLIKSIGPWSVFSITNVGNDDTFKLTDNVFSIPGTQSYLENQLLSKDYSGGLWVDATDIGGDLEKTLKKKFYPLNCESCRVENLGKYADIPVVRILPNSPLYQIKQRINNKSILEAKDDNSKAGVYLGLVMIKLSEVRSMYQLKTEKEFIDRGLKDMSLYLQAIEDIFSRSPSTTQNFYLASLVYETLNPVQRYLRDYVSSSDYNSEKQFIRDDILKILWQSMSIKKLFDPIVAQEERWSSEKFYNLNLPRGSTYNFLIDSETLPFGLDGNYIKPSKILLDGEGDDKVKLENIVDERFLATNSVAVAKDGGIHLYFSNLPNLFELKGWKTLDFPEGSKGCLEGTINYFTKSRMYRFKISSAKYSDSLRLYVKEKSG